MNKFSIKALAKSFDEANHTMTCIMSAEVIDRHGEIVDIESMNIDNFMLNPVVLQSHDYDELSVGKVLEIRKNLDGNIKTMECDIKFAVEEYEVAKTHWGLYSGGYMSAFSIGFRVGGVVQDPAVPCNMPDCPIAMSMGACVNCQNSCTRLINCELLEISCVSVPANQLALAKSKGLDISPLLKTIPDRVLSKEIAEALIEVKSLLLQKDSKVDTKEKAVILDSRGIAQQKAKSLVELAIKALCK